MKKNLLALPIFTLLLFSLSCYSQTKSPDDLSKDFFDLYAVKNYELALKNIFSTNKYLENSDLSQLSNKMLTYDKVLGNYKGYEKIIQKNVGETINIQVYLLRYKRQPVRFIFTYYNDTEEWKILNFKMNEKFTEEIEKAVIQLSYN